MFSPRAPPINRPWRTATTTNTQTEAKEVDPVYGEKNGLDLIELQDNKPEVAEVVVDNEPDRIAMNITEDPSTEMAFNWYTKDDLDDSMLRVSDQEDMSGAMEFPAETTEVTSRYAERDKDGYYIYAAAATDEEDEFILDEEGKPKEIKGYFTDEQITRENTKWTSEGPNLGYLELVDVKENSNKSTATGLEPGKKYYFQVGSESEGFSETGTFTTSDPNADQVQFIHYTDTQNAYWNANVNNEAAYGANTLEKAMEVAPDATFAVHTGDFVETAAVEDEWVDNLNMSRKANLNLPHAYPTQPRRVQPALGGRQGPHRLQRAHQRASQQRRSRWGFLLLLRPLRRSLRCVEHQRQQGIRGQPRRRRHRQKADGMGEAGHHRSPRSRCEVDRADLPQAGVLSVLPRAPGRGRSSHPRGIRQNRRRASPTARSRTQRRRPSTELSTTSTPKASPTSSRTPPARRHTTPFTRKVPTTSTRSVPSSTG